MDKAMSRKPLHRHSWFVPFLFLLARLMMLITLPLEGIYGFGDIKHFYNLTQLGVPYVDYWVEFPPVFPFVSLLLQKLAGVREHNYVYLLVIFLSLVQAVTIFVFMKLCELAHQEAELRWRVFAYTVLTLGLVYGWWYFDPLAVLFALLSIYYLLTGRDIRAGLAVAAGILVKLFPILVLPAVWLFAARRRALKITLIAIGTALLIYLVLYIISPEYTLPSLASQLKKGSWETIWALIDGNAKTGNFGPLVERLDPEFAFRSQGNPARVSPILTIIFFLAIGAWLFYRSRVNEPVSLIAFIGLTWCIFLLWSPGWSPQWILYLIPLILLTLAERDAILLTVILILVNLLEWPVLLSRGYQWGLFLTIPLRTLALLLLAWLWYRQIPEKAPTSKESVNVQNASD